MSTKHCTIDSQLGDLTLVAENDTVTGVYFPKHWHLPADTDFGPLVNPVYDALFSRTAAQLHEFLDGARTSFDLPTTLHGTPLHRRVRGLLPEIPYGVTVTYGELAAALGVVGKDGKLTGYAGGLTRKRFLLEREESSTSRFSKLF